MIYRYSRQLILPSFGVEAQANLLKSSILVVRVSSLGSPALLYLAVCGVGRCYDAERKRYDRERHPIYQKDKHALYPVEITGIPDDTKDSEIAESEFFDTRQTFLSLCQGNHYQYDTLRRAKHSSMMVLYHLHNPTVPTFVTTCAVCHLTVLDEVQESLVDRGRVVDMLHCHY